MKTMIGRIGVKHDGRFSQEPLPKGVSLYVYDGEVRDYEMISCFLCVMGVNTYPSSIGIETNLSNKGLESFIVSLRGNNRYNSEKLFVSLSSDRDMWTCDWMFLVYLAKKYDLGIEVLMELPHPNNVTGCSYFNEPKSIISATRSYYSSHTRTKVNDRFHCPIMSSPGCLG